LADGISAFLTYSNFIRIKDLVISILSLRVCLRRSLGYAERFIKNSEEIAELFPDPPKAGGISGFASTSPPIVPLLAMAGFFKIR
jgi:hypothetical protein